MKPFDVVILGAGLGGLVSGGVLARAGLRVLLIEKAAAVGGGIRVVPDGEWHLPTGPHGFPSDHIEPAFARAGVRAPLYETGGYVLYNCVKKKSYPFLHSVDEPDETKMEKYNIEPADYAEVSRVLANIDPDTWRGLTLAQWLAALDAPQKVKKIFSNSAVWATDCALTPDVISMDIFPMGAFGLFIGVVNWAEYNNDQQLPEAFAEGIVRAGGEIRMECEVEEVEIEGKRVRGVRFNDRRRGTVEHVAADRVICDIPFNQVVKGGYIASDHLPPQWVEAAPNIERHSGGFVTSYYGLRERVIDNDKAIYLFGLDPESGTHTAPLGLIVAYSNVVKTLAPEGKQILCSLIQIRPSERNDWDAIEQKAAQVDRNTREYLADLGLPDLDSVCEMKRTHVAMPTWGQYIWSTYYNNLPDLKAPGVEGLYFVGNMVKTSPGMFGISATADAALRLCDLLLGERT